MTQGYSADGPTAFLPHAIIVLPMGPKFPPQNSKKMETTKKIMAPVTICPSRFTRKSAYG
jgi:hypothetical protein